MAVERPGTNWVSATDVPYGQSLIPTAVAVEGLPAHVHLGTWDRLRSDLHVDLTNLTTGEGEWVGFRRTLVAEMFVSVINISLDDLVTDRWAIDVPRDRETNGDPLVCGEIGGAPNADGSLAIGLREVNRSGDMGAAYLVAHPNDPNQTQARAFVASKLAEDERQTPEPAASPIASHTPHWRQRDSGANQGRGPADA